MLHNERIRNLIKKRESLFKEIVEKEKKIREIDQKVVSAFSRNRNEDSPTLPKDTRGKVRVSLKNSSSLSVIFPSAGG